MTYSYYYYFCCMERQLIHINTYLFQYEDTASQYETDEVDGGCPSEEVIFVLFS